MKKTLFTLWSAAAAFVIGTESVPQLRILAPYTFWVLFVIGIVFGCCVLVHMFNVWPKVKKHFLERDDGS
jgi:membrane protein implicated in regulation of membrane protease activity